MYFLQVGTTATFRYDNSIVLPDRKDCTYVYFNKPIYVARWVECALFNIDSPLYHVVR